jgi:hypothetical protein
VLKRIAEADTVEKLEALLPWNVDLVTSKKWLNTVSPDFSQLLQQASQTSPVNARVE